MDFGHPAEECRLFLGKKKNAEFVTITDDYSSLERFDLKTRKKLESLECFFKLQIISSSSRRRREGNGFVARQRRFMGIFLTLRCIEETRSHLIRKRETILYLSFNMYPGGASHPWWENHEALFFFRFRFRRTHFLQLIDAMNLTGSRRFVQCQREESIGSAQFF